MAQLLKTSIDLPPLSLNGRPFIETEHHKAFQELSTKHDMISFPVADGYAHYVVRSMSPLRLQHVNYLDGYQVFASTIRGLRRKEVEQLIAFEKSWGA